MKPQYLLSPFIFIGLVVIGCTTLDKNNDSPIVGQDWALGMREMATTLEKLSPYVFSRQEYNDPANKDQIERMLSKFAIGVDRLPKHTGEALLGKDPLLQYSIAQLQANTRHAEMAFKDGQTEFSRNVMSQNIGLCFSCHSTQNLGPQNNFSVTTLSTNFRLYPSEKADYYVATRQFDKALDTLEGVVRSPYALLDDPHEQLKALRKYLFIQIRVKQNPGPAILLLDSYLAWDKLPYFMAIDARAWLDSLKEWQTEKKSKSTDVAHAINLLRKGDTRQIQGSQSGLVDYLRASNILHEALRSATEAQNKAEIYSLLGQSYDTFSDLNSWELPEVYFESCVRTVPKTALSKQCYKNYERTVILGFSGSAGIFIPQEQRNLLIELKTLSGL